MTDRQSPRDTRRRELLDVARGLFVSQGYAKTPVSAIVRAAGVAQGTFYLYFANKQALLAELRRDLFRDYAVTLRDIVEGPGEPDDKLCRIVWEMADAVQRNLELERVLRQAESAEDTLRVAREGRARLAQAAAGLIEQGQAQGRFDCPDHQLAARLVVTLYDTLLYEAHAYEPEQLDRVVRASLRFVLRGVGLPPERAERLIQGSRP